MSRPRRDSRLQPGALAVMPSGACRVAWRRDYEAMRESMFFGDTPSFDEILDQRAESESAATREALHEVRRQLGIE